MQQNINVRKSWLIVGMLFLFMVLNFADKAILGLAAGPIIDELKLTHTQFGQIGSSFFLLFSLSAILVGFLVNRVSTKWVLTFMSLIWALVQLPMMFFSGLPLLLANRILLGAGEGPAYAVALHSAYKWFPNERRPLPTSIIAIGVAVGTGVVAPGITYVILNYSWHAAFGVLGILGLVWTLAWAAIGQEGPLSASTVGGASNEPRVSYFKLLTCRSVIGCIVLEFSAYWLLTLAVVWLPNYLNKAAGYSPTAVGWIVTLPAFVQIIVVPVIGAFSENLKRRGFSSRVSRGVLASGCVMLSGSLTFLLPMTNGFILPIVCTTVAFSVGAVAYILGHVIVAEVSPVSQRGALLGIINALATLAGICAPLVMGMIVDVGSNPLEGFRIGFMVAGGLVVLGSLIGLMLISPESDIERLSRQSGAASPLEATKIADLGPKQGEQGRVAARA